MFSVTPRLQLWNHPQLDYVKHISTVSEPTHLLDNPPNCGNVVWPGVTAFVVHIYFGILSTFSSFISGFLHRFSAVIWFAQSQHLHVLPLPVLSSVYCGLRVFTVCFSWKTCISSVTGKLHPKWTFWSRHANPMAKDNVPSVFSWARSEYSCIWQFGALPRDKNNCSMLYNPFWNWPFHQKKSGARPEWACSHNLPTTHYNRSYGWQVVLV